MFKKLLGLLLIPSLAFGIPTSPPNGGLGVSNPPDALITTQGATTIHSGTILNSTEVLQPSNNLSDVADTTDSRGNLGLPSDVLILNQSQNYTLTNPSPGILWVNIPTAGHVLKLPPIGVPGALDPTTEIVIAAASTSAVLDVQDSNGNHIFTLNAGQLFVAVPVGTTIQPPTGWYVQQRSADGAQDMQSTYGYGSTINLANSQPIKFVTGTSYGSPQNLNTLFTPYYQPAPSQSAMIGMAFTPSVSGRVTALGYLNAVFPSGTRDVGLWSYTSSVSGVLLATATVTTSDPLDPQTGQWRMHSITPVSLVAGTRYVVAALNPAGEQNLYYQAVITPWSTINGQSQANFYSPTLTYPTIVNTLNEEQCGNSNLEFESGTGNENVLFNDPVSNPSTLYQAVSTARGAHPIPSMTAAQRDAISAPSIGDQVFVTDNDRQYIWVGDWEPFVVGNSFASSITGTADQVLVNGTSGSPQTGAITLTLSQSLATTSSPQFNSVILDGVGAALKMQDNTAGSGQAYNPINWYGLTSTSAATQYARIIPTIVSNTNGAMTSKLGFYVQDAGFLSQYLNLDGSTASIELLKNLDGSLVDATFNNVTVLTLSENQLVGTDASKKLTSIAISGKKSVRLATTAALSATYNNGTSGVGATLTNSGAQFEFDLDGYVGQVGDRILVKNQASQLQNGIYVLTDAGSESSNWVLTRATDYDSSFEIGLGDSVFIASGDLNANTYWVQDAQAPVTVGTTGITFGSFLANLNSVVSGKILRSVAGLPPSYSTSTFSDTYSASNLLYSNGANTVQGLATANNGTLVTNGSGVPSISSTLPNAVQDNITRLGTIATEFNSTGQPANIRSSVSGTQTINNNTVTAVNIYDTSLKNQGGISYSSGTYTVPSSGIYLISAVFSFPANTTGMREIYFTINSSGLYAPQTINGVQSGIPTRITATLVYPLAANDTVTVEAYQTSGSNFACGGGNLDANTQMFGIIKLF